MVMGILAGVLLPLVGTGPAVAVVEDARPIVTPDWGHDALRSATAPRALPYETRVPHRVYVAVPTNLGAPSYTSQEMDAAVDEAIARWRASVPVAFDDMVRVGEPVPYVATVPATRPRCGIDGRDWVPEVRQVLGLGPADADLVAEHVVVFFPSACTGGGFGGNGDEGGNSWSDGAVAISGGSDNVNLAQVVEHELGHNVGFGHANRVCGAGCPLAPAPVVRYGDCYSVMGSGRGVVSTAHRVVDGVVEPGELVSVDGDAGAVDRVVSIAPRGTSGGARGVGVTDSETGRTYYLDYRAPVGLDPAEPCPAGVTAMTVEGHETLLIPRTQQSPVDAASSMWPVGSVIPLSPNVTATVVAADPSWGAQLVVHHASLPPARGPVRPRLVGGLYRNGFVRVDYGRWKPKGARVDYRWYVDGVLQVRGSGEPVPDRLFSPQARTGLLSAVMTIYAPGHRRTVVQVPARRLVGRDHLPRVRVRGQAHVGEIVRAVVGKPKSVHGRWRVEYQWRVGAARLEDDAPQLRLLPYMKGQRISVRVTATWRGYELVTTSRYTRPVRG